MLIYLVAGARPNFMKIAPIVRALQAQQALSFKIIHTGQHYDREMNDVFFEELGIPEPDVFMAAGGGSHGQQTAKIMVGFEELCMNERPAAVLVVGDVNSTLACSIVAKKLNIPVAHVEAGLRTGNLYSPWPEEANRKLTGALAAIHFAPTESSSDNLRAEGIPTDRIEITGNTVIDALKQVVQRIERTPALRAELSAQFSFLRPERRVVLVTGHRRESFGGGFERICHALRDIALRHPDVDIVYPVHLNPQVREPVNRLLSDMPQIHLIEPLDYLPFVYLMNAAHIILTDSGGIQEEAPSLGKPVLVMRDTTERPEAVGAGTVKLVGTDRKAIADGITALLDDPAAYQAMSIAHNPYGDGKACQRIVEALAGLKTTASQLAA